MTNSQLEYYYHCHMEKTNQIWNDLRFRLRQKYLDQGYNMWFAEVKAEREVLELRNLPRAVEQMHIPKEQTLQGDLD